MTTKLDKDQLPWLTVSQEIMASKYDNANSSTKEALRIGLRSIPHESCQKALIALDQIRTRKYAR